MSDVIVKWRTAQFIRKHLDKLDFLSNFAIINPYLQAEYSKLQHYAETYESEFSRGKYGARHVDELEDYLDNVQKFQLFVRDNKDDHDAIAVMAKQLLNPSEGTEIRNARCIDIEIYDKVMYLLDIAAPVNTLLNSVCILAAVGSHRPIGTELEYEIRSYIQSKNADVLLTYKSDQ